MATGRRHGLRVASASLCAAEREHRVGRIPRKHRNDRSHLNWIAERGSGAVGLDAAKLVRDQGAIGERGLQKRLLCLTVWCRQRGALAVLPHAAANQARASLDARRGGAHGHRATCLASRVPVGAPVKGVTTPACGEHPRHGKRQVAVRQQHQIDPEHQAKLALALP
eukprot:scaffold123610_cov25-Tisochrysis_lutea.AAC.3